VGQVLAPLSKHVFRTFEGVQGAHGTEGNNTTTPDGGIYSTIKGRGDLDIRHWVPELLLLF